MPDLKILDREEMLEMEPNVAEDAQGFIDCAGIESPGLTSAPAIGKMAAGILREKLHLEEKNDFIAERKGILDPEYFTQESSMATSKRQAEGGSQVGLISAWTADAEAGGNVDQFVLLEALQGPDGNRYVENASNYLDISDRELVISKDCENPEKLLAWADDFYDNVATLQTTYGSISDGCVTDNGDGTYTVNEPEDGGSLDTSAWSNSLKDFGPKYMTDDFAANVTLPADQGDGIKLQEDEVNAKYVTTDKNVGFPMVQYTSDEQNTLTMLGTDIYQYVEAQYAHWVVDGGIEEEWDAYLEQLDAMGLQDLVKAQTDAYNAYIEALNE